MKKFSLPTALKEQLSSARSSGDEIRFFALIRSSLRSFLRDPVPFLDRLRPSVARVDTRRRRARAVHFLRAALEKAQRRDGTPGPGCVWSSRVYEKIHP